MPVDINWGMLGNAPNAGQAFMQGMEQGQQRRKEAQLDNALRYLGQNPNDQNALNQIMSVDPRLGLQLRKDQTQRMEMTQRRDLTGAALRGDAGAMDQLAGLDPEMWARLDKRAQDATERRVKLIGQSALYADTPEKWDQVIDQLAPQYPELAEYRGKFSPQMRAAAIAQAGEMSKFIDQQRIRFVPVGENGSFAIDYMGNPVGQGNPFAPQAASAPPQASAGLPPGIPDNATPATITPQQAAVVRQSLGPEGQRAFEAWLRGNNVTQAPGGNNDQLLREAQHAIARGADPAAVQARLRQMGVQ